MNRIPLIFLTLITLLPACARQDAAPTDPAAATAAQAAVAPDAGKFETHLNEHMELPADRAAILAACADTPEFTEAEKRWVADNLPEGSYETSEQVMTALGLE